jgi:hypothetical protein
MLITINNQDVNIDSTRTIVTVNRHPHEPFVKVFFFNLMEVTYAWLREMYYPGPEYYWLVNLKREAEALVKNNFQLKLELS